MQTARKLISFLLITALIADPAVAAGMGGPPPGAATPAAVCPLFTQEAFVSRLTHHQILGKNKKPKYLTHQMESSGLGVLRLPKWIHRHLPWSWVAPHTSPLDKIPTREFIDYLRSVVPRGGRFLSVNPGKTLPSQYGAENLPELEQHALWAGAHVGVFEPSALPGAYWKRQADRSLYFGLNTLTVMPGSSAHYENLPLKPRSAYVVAITDATEFLLLKAVGELHPNGRLIVRWRDNSPGEWQRTKTALNLLELHGYRLKKDRTGPFWMSFTVKAPPVVYDPDEPDVEKQTPFTQTPHAWVRPTILGVLGLAGGATPLFGFDGVHAANVHPVPAMGSLLIASAVIDALFSKRGREPWLADLLAQFGKRPNSYKNALTVEEFEGRVAQLFVELKDMFEVLGLPGTVPSQDLYSEIVYDLVVDDIAQTPGPDVKLGRLWNRVNHVENMDSRRGIFYRLSKHYKVGTHELIRAHSLWTLFGDTESFWGHAAVQALQRQIATSDRLSGLSISQGDADPIDPRPDPEASLAGKDRVLKAFQATSPRDRSVVIQRSVHEETLQQVSVELELKPKRIRQIEKKASKKLARRLTMPFHQIKQKKSVEDPSSALSSIRSASGSKGGRKISEAGQQLRAWAELRRGGQSDKRPDELTKQFGLKLVSVYKVFKEFGISTGLRRGRKPRAVLGALALVGGAALFDYGVSASVIPAMASWLIGFTALGRLYEGPPGRIGLGGSEESADQAIETVRTYIAVNLRYLKAEKEVSIVRRVELRHPDHENLPSFLEAPAVEAQRWNLRRNDLRGQFDTAFQQILERHSEVGENLSSTMESIEKLELAYRDAWFALLDDPDGELEFDAHSNNLFNALNEAIEKTENMADYFDARFPPAEPSPKRAALSTALKYLLARRFLQNIPDALINEFLDLEKIDRDTVGGAMMNYYSEVEYMRPAQIMPQIRKVQRSAGAEPLEHSDVYLATIYAIREILKNSADPSDVGFSLNDVLDQKALKEPFHWNGGSPLRLAVARLITSELIEHNIEVEGGLLGPGDKNGNYKWRPGSPSAEKKRSLFRLLAVLPVWMVEPAHWAAAADRLASFTALDFILIGVVAVVIGAASASGPEDSRRDRLVEVLKKLGHWEIKILAVGIEGARQLGVDGKMAIPDLIEIYGRYPAIDPAIDAALEAIGSPTDAEISILLELLHPDQARSVRLRAGRLLAEIKCQKAIPYLVSMRADNSATLRTAAKVFLEAIGEPEPGLIPDLILIGQKALNVAQKIPPMKLLITFGEEAHAAIPLAVLMAASNDPSESVVGLAASDAFGVPTVDELAVLMSMLDDESQEVQALAAEAIGKMEGAGQPALLAMAVAWAHLDSADPEFERHQTMFYDAMIQIGQPTSVIPSLVQLAASTEESQSKAAETTLKQIGKPTIKELPELLSFLETENSRTQVRAIRSIGEMDKATAIEAVFHLVDASQSPDRDVAEAAREVLTSWGIKTERGSAAQLLLWITAVAAVVGFALMRPEAEGSDYTFMIRAYTVAVLYLAIALRMHWTAMAAARVLEDRTYSMAEATEAKLSPAQALGISEDLKTGYRYDKSLLGSGFRFDLVSGVEQTAYWFVSDVRKSKARLLTGPRVSFQDLIEYDAFDKLQRIVRIYNDLPDHVLENGELTLYLLPLSKSNLKRFKLIIPTSAVPANQTLRLNDVRYRLRDLGEIPGNANYHRLAIETETRAHELYPAEAAPASPNNPPGQKGLLQAA